MQFEELQMQWQRLDEKIERTLKLENELLHLAAMQPIRRRVNRLAVWPAIDTALCAGILLFAGNFIAVHWSSPSLIAPVGVLIVAAIALLGDSIRQLIQVSQIDWDGTVVDIQSSLSRVRISKIRQFKWVLLFSPLVGFCGLIVGLQWLLDSLPGRHFILEKLNPWWVVANYAFGVLFIPFGHGIVRFLARRFGNKGGWQRLLDDISGNSMCKAKAELKRWSSLNDEPLGDVA
jgi:hypothetical protein